MEPKSSVHYVILTKSSAQNAISTGNQGMEIPFKEILLFFNIFLESSTLLQITIFHKYWLILIKNQIQILSRRLNYTISLQQKIQID